MQQKPTSERQTSTKPGLLIKNYDLKKAASKPSAINPFEELQHFLQYGPGKNKEYRAPKTADKRTRKKSGNAPPAIFFLDKAALLCYIKMRYQGVAGAWAQHIPSVRE